MEPKCEICLTLWPKARNEPPRLWLPATRCIPLMTAESHGSTLGHTPYHSQFLAHRLTLEGLGEDALARSLSTARVEMKPHQVDAVLFALQSPLAKGAPLFVTSRLMQKAKAEKHTCEIHRFLFFPKRMANRG
jgi:hypothetical protein